MKFAKWWGFLFNVSSRTQQCIDSLILYLLIPFFTLGNNIMSQATNKSITMWSLLNLLLSQASIFAIASLNTSQSPEALATRSYFYVGGEYVDV